MDHAEVVEDIVRTVQSGTLQLADVLAHNVLRLVVITRSNASKPDPAPTPAGGHAQLHPISIRLPMTVPKLEASANGELGRTICPIAHQYARQSVNLWLSPCSRSPKNIVLYIRPLLTLLSLTIDPLAQPRSFSPTIWNITETIWTRPTSAIMVVKR